MPSTMRLIARQTLSVDTASVTFSNIPQTYTDLRLVVSARTDRANNGDSMYLQFNNDTTSANYSNRILYGTGSSAVSITSATAILLTQGACGSSDTANTFGSSEAYIPNYTGSTTKSVSHQGNSETNAATSYMSVDAGLWSGTAPITSMLLRPGNGTAFRSGSTFFLYGVTSAAGSIPGVFGVDATGGDVTISGGYKYHVFKSSGTFTVNAPGFAEILAVAGGGGGGGLGGGGGGGGLLPIGVARLVSPGTYPVLVGAGGSGVIANAQSSGSNGSDSSAAGVVAIGGGGGGTYFGSGRGNNGGSGGGAGNSGVSAASGVAGQGNSGGVGFSQSGSPDMIAGGGGGGYSAAGSNATSLLGGNGGQGYTIPTEVRALLDNFTVLSSGGGGGARYTTYSTNGTPGTGGTGAGNGSTNGATAGSATTYGGGGGGSGQTAPSGSWGASGSGYQGVIVIRYPVS